MVAYLAHRGFSPAYQKGSEYWYKSPFRNEKTPSFKVNTNAHTSKNHYWDDFGTGEGGTIIDLVVKMDSASVSQAIALLLKFDPHLRENDTQFNIPLDLPKKHKLRKKEKKSPGVKIEKIKDLNNAALIEYVKSRKINLQIAEKFLKEAYYTLNGKVLFGLAFQNDQGGYELQNKYIKTATNKAITSFNLSDHTEVILFEGISDFLTYLTRNQGIFKKYGFIILNTVGNKDQAIHTIKENSHIKGIHLFFDHDDGGRNACKKLTKTFSNLKVIDHSGKYEGYNDLNDFHLGIRQESSKN